MEAKKEDTLDQDDATIVSFDEYFKDRFNRPAVAIFGMIGGHRIEAELALAKMLFIEMTYTCARAYVKIYLKDICFNELWFKETFKKCPNRICCLTYSACQPLLSKYSALFEQMMSMWWMRVKHVENLDMLHISFEPEEQLVENWIKNLEE